ncbi:hypothetical protein F4780DRAFT_755084 [Xylariomycetidae sp. FL0641]|nr:hypothetical protein F4780DRAFT_755084 [Xylariomycetidae sp. FL0641]
MAYEWWVARMTVQQLDQGESFPERHIADLVDLTLQDSHRLTSALPSVSSKSPKCATRPPRAPSESPEGYEMRGRYWDAADVLSLDLEESKKAPDVWDYIYDPVCLPPTGMRKTSTIRRLGAMPILRAWRRRSDHERPELGRTHVVEGIMTFERGQILDGSSRCDRCKAREGVSKECVVVVAGHGEVNGEASGETACSNCLYDGVGDKCHLRAPLASCLQPKKDKADREAGETHSRVTNPRKEDYMTVLKLIDQMKPTSSSGQRDLDAATKAKRIEEAALQVARAAREWGRREGPS